MAPTKRKSRKTVATQSKVVGQKKERKAKAIAKIPKEVVVNEPKEIVVEKLPKKRNVLRSAGALKT